MDRTLLIAAIGLGTAACYNPTYDECVIACGSAAGDRGPCPNGLSCNAQARCVLSPNPMDKSCDVGSGSNPADAGIDAPKDAGSGSGSGSGSGCPQVPQGMDNCDVANPIAPTVSPCYSLCERTGGSGESGTTALAFLAGGSNWHIAHVGSAGDEGQLEQVLIPGGAWIGAQRGSAGGNATDFTWEDGSPVGVTDWGSGQPMGPGLCVLATQNGWVAADCSESHPWVIDFKRPM